MEWGSKQRAGVAVVAVVLVVLVAGCSSVSQQRGPGGNSSAGADLDGATLRNGTVDALRSAGSYTVTRVRNQTTERQSQVIRETIEVNRTAERGLQRRHIRKQREGRDVDGTTTVYTTAENSFKRLKGRDETYYAATTGERPARISRVSFDPSSHISSSLVDGLEWKRTGTETFDGTSVTRYEATGIANRDVLVGQNTTIESFDGVMLVDDGVIRRLDTSATYVTDGETEHARLLVAFTDVGSTTVEEPDWLDKARDAAADERP